MRRQSYHPPICFPTTAQHRQSSQHIYLRLCGHNRRYVYCDGAPRRHLLIPDHRWWRQIRRRFPLSRLVDGWHSIHVPSNYTGKSTLILDRLFHRLTVWRSIIDPVGQHSSAWMVINKKGSTQRSSCVQCALVLVKVLCCLFNTVTERLQAKADQVHETRHRRQRGGDDDDRPVC